MQPMSYYGMPSIFHRTDFISAPRAAGTAVWRSLKSHETFFPHPAWIHMRWDERAFLRITRTKHWSVPHAEYLLECGAWATVSDFLRIYALYMYGGVYADWDVEFVRQICSIFSMLNSCIAKQQVLLGFEPYTYAGHGTAQAGVHIILSFPNHPMWRTLYTIYAGTLWTEQFDILPQVL